jgi:transketolase
MTAHPDVNLLKEKARAIRTSVVESLAVAGSGHLGGSLGLADVFSVLYFHQLNHKPANPNWPLRDRLILSIGHVAPVLYASLAHSGYFDPKELLTLRKLGSRLQGHPGKDKGLPGLEISSGSLGQGLSVACGIALAARLDKAAFRTWCIMGDGELQEGSVWEAAMCASHYKLNNLTAIVDRNYCQIDGSTENVMSLEPLAEKWKSFGWNVEECNGNDIPDIIRAFSNLNAVQDKPTIVLAKTKMGKGVKEIEDDYRWHGKVPDKEQSVRFIQQIEQSWNNPE